MYSLFQRPSNLSRRQFTGKERDVESGLDFFGARYMSSAQGRFTSPDPLLLSAKLVDPQTWNRYMYARNNPLRYTDPLGLFPSPAFSCSDGQTACLNDEQRRILNNSSVQVNGQKLSGEALYNAVGNLKDGEARQNAFVNITDRLASTPLGGGRGNALSQVSSLTGIDPDRIFANIGFGTASAFIGQGFAQVPSHGDPFDGPSFKNTDGALGNIQFTFTKDLSRSDIDQDIGNIAARNPFNSIVGGIVHTGEVIQNGVFGTKTNQDTIRNILINNPKVQTITPSPDPRFNRSRRR